jgi:hypothetical protein
MTENLKKFTVFTVVWSAPFFFALNWGVDNSEQYGALIVLFSLIYGLGFSIAGKQLGKRDDDSRVRYNLGAAYGAVATLIPSSFGVAWVIGWQRKDLWQIILYLLPMIAVFTVGIYQYKRTIKGMKKEKLFR